MSDCPFCEVSERVIKKNEHAIVILSNPRKVPGHALVIPKRHVEEPWQLSDAERLSVFELLDWTSQKLITAKLGDGVDVRQNFRPFAQKGKLGVRHIHFHAVPRAKDDYIYQVSEKYDAELFAELDVTEAREVRNLLG